MRQWKDETVALLCHSPQASPLIQPGMEKATTQGCWPVTVSRAMLRKGTERHHSTPPGGCSQPWLPSS